MWKGASTLILRSSTRPYFTNFATTLPPCSQTHLFLGVPEVAVKMVGQDAGRTWGQIMDGGISTN